MSSSAGLVLEEAAGAFVESGRGLLEEDEVEEFVDMSRENGGKGESLHSVLGLLQSSGT